MRKLRLLVLSIFSFLFCYSQETFKYKNLTVSFPDKYNSREVSGINAFYANKDNVSYQAMIIEDTSRTLKTSNELFAFLEGTSMSFLQTVGSDFKNRTVDTTIGGVKGRFIHVYKPTEHHVFIEAYVFFTALLNQPYAIQVMIFDSINEISKKRIEDFYNSVKFEGKQFDSLSIAAASQTNYTLSFLDVKSVTFPSKYDSLNQKGIKIYYTKQSNIGYQIMYSTTADFDSSDQYKHDYDSFLKGYFSSNSIKPFTCEVKDSIIGRAKGKFIHGHLTDKPIQLFTFITMLHGRSYMIQIISLTTLNGEMRERINSFFRSITF